MAEEPVVNIRPPAGPQSPTAPLISRQNSILEMASSELKAAVQPTAGEVFAAPATGERSLWDKYREVWTQTSLFDNFGPYEFAKGTVWLALDEAANVAELWQGLQASTPQAPEGSPGAALSKASRESGAATAVADWLNQQADAIGAPTSAAGRMTAEVGRYAAPALTAWYKAPQIAMRGAPLMRKGLSMMNYGIKAMAAAAADFGTGMALDDPSQSAANMLASMSEDEVRELFGKWAGPALLARDVLDGLQAPEGTMEEGKAKPEGRVAASAAMGMEQALTNVAAEGLLLTGRAIVKALKYLQSDKAALDEVINAGWRAEQISAALKAQDPSLRTSPTPAIMDLDEIARAGETAALVRDISPASAADYRLRVERAQAAADAVVAAIAFAKDHAVRARRLMARKEKWMRGEGLEVGALKNQSRRLPGPVVNGEQMPDVVIGRPSTDEWIERVETWLSPAEITKAGEWYRNVLPAFINAMGAEDGVRALVAWVQASAQASPTEAFETYLRMQSQITHGVPFDQMMMNSSNGQYVAEFLLGQKPRGFGQKIADFFDSSRRKQTRLYFDDDSFMGAPFVVDRHTFNGMGGITSGFVRALEARKYLKNVKWDGEAKTWTAETAGGEKITLVNDAPSGTSEKEGGIRGALYESNAEYGRSLTQDLNNRAWMGRTDWEPSDIQAIDWASIQRIKKNPLETPEDVLAYAQHRVSFEIFPGTGAPWDKSGLGERLSKLPIPMQREIAQRLTVRIQEAVQRELGIMVGVPIHGQGGWIGGIAPHSLVSRVFELDDDQITRTLNLIGYLAQQTQVWGSRIWDQVPSGQKVNASALILTGKDLRDPARIEALFAGVHHIEGAVDAEGERIFGGFQPYTAADGTPGIAILVRHKGDTDEAALAGQALVAGFRPQIEDVVGKVSGGDVHVDIKAANVMIAENDWSAKPNGEGYLEFLGAEGGEGAGGRSAERGGPHRALREELDDELKRAVEDAEAFVNGTEPPKPKGGGGRKGKRKGKSFNLTAAKISIPDGREIVADGFKSDQGALYTAGKLWRSEGVLTEPVRMPDGSWALVPFEKPQGVTDAEGRVLEALNIIGEGGATQDQVLSVAKMLVGDVGLDKTKRDSFYAAYPKSIANPNNPFSPGSPGRRGAQISIGGSSAISMSSVPQGQEGRMLPADAAMRHETGHAVHEEMDLEFPLGSPVRSALVEISALQRPWLWTKDGVDAILATRPGMTEEGVVKYRMQRHELAADLISSLLGPHARKVREKYPEAVAWLRKRVNENPQLRHIVQFMGLGAILLGTEEMVDGDADLEG